MPKTPTAEKPKRLTLTDHLREQQALLMALATKQPRQAAQTISLDERSNGPDSGILFVKLGLIQSEDEDDAAFLVRMETFAIAALEVRDRLNDAQAERKAAAAGSGTGA